MGVGLEAAGGRYVPGIGWVEVSERSQKVQPVRARADIEVSIDDGTFNELSPRAAAAVLVAGGGGAAQRVSVERKEGGAPAEAQGRAGLGIFLYALRNKKLQIYGICQFRLGPDLLEPKLLCKSILFQSATL